MYSLAFNKDRSKLAVAVSGEGKSAIYVGNPDGTGMNRVSTSELATRPAWSRRASWLGSAENQPRVLSASGSTASPSHPPASPPPRPVFATPEDGVKLVYSVAVGGNRQDLVIAAEKGQNMARLTQKQGSNSYPACSPDGRLLAFFSNRNKSPGIWLMSLKSWKAQQISTQEGESLNWSLLPAAP